MIDKIKIGYIFGLSIILSLAILTISYPGFMSYDSIRMLQEARTGVLGGIYPAMPVYILRLFDIFGFGSTLMLEVQNLAVIFFLGLIFSAVGASRIQVLMGLLIVLMLPTVLGCMLVLWKDVTFTALALASIALIYLSDLKDCECKYAYYLNIAFSFLFLFIATLIRFNALTSTAIIFIYWINIYFSKNKLIEKLVIYLLIIASLIFSNQLINGYKFPSLQKLESNPIVYVVMINDLLGVSKWSNISFLPFDSSFEITEKSSIQDINKIYSPLGAVIIDNKNSQLGNPVKFFPSHYENQDIFWAWLKAIAKYPFSYLQFRWDIFSEIVGATQHETYEPTHFAQIDQNAFGLHESGLGITDATLRYIKWASGEAFGKPWFIFLASIIFIVLSGRSPRIKKKTKNLGLWALISALSYIAPFFIISGTGEVRYAYPAIVLCCIPIGVWFFGRKASIEQTQDIP
jgi:hypothetical protein